MRFYDREQEIAFLRQTRETARRVARIGRWWDRKGENEIDLIAEDELSDKVKFCEVKRRRDEISIGVLKQKAEAFLNATREFKGYKIEYEGLSMEDM